jgi:3-phenylpropionate/trans-cinnamate dioxygenase ferredoxin reductase subunit
VIHVIVGAGEAGVGAALAMRSHGYAGRVLIVGAEHHAPYTRPPLSKAVLTGDEVQLPEIARGDALAQKGIEIKLRTRVAAIDRATGSLACEDGTRIAYDNLVLATGCRARRLALPGASHERVRYLRGYDDALAIRARLIEGARVVLVGGGYIGLEIAAAARQRGCIVTVLEQADAVMSRVAGPEVAGFFARLHESRGVAIRTGARLVGFEHHGNTTEVRLGDGSTLAADLVVVGIGAQPRTELAEQAGLAIGNGIVVDEYGRTDDARIFACGDVANHPNAHLGRRLRLESWQNAQQQAAVVGATLAGKPRPYAMVPWFWSDQYGVNLQMIGCPAGWDETIVRGSPDSGSFTVIHLERGLVVGGSAINRPRDVPPLRSAIEKRIAPDRSVLSQPDTPIAQVFKAQARRLEDVA